MQDSHSRNFFTCLMSRAENLTGAKAHLFYREKKDVISPYISVKIFRCPSIGSIPRFFHRARANDDAILHSRFYIPCKRLCHWFGSQAQLHGADIFLSLRSEQRIWSNRSWKSEFD